MYINNSSTKVGIQQHLKKRDHLVRTSRSTLLEKLTGFGNRKPHMLTVDIHCTICKNKPVGFFSTLLRAILIDCATECFAYARINSF